MNTNMTSFAPDKDLKNKGIYTGLLDGFWSISSEGKTRPFGPPKGDALS